MNIELRDMAALAALTGLLANGDYVANKTVDIALEYADQFMAAHTFPDKIEIYTEQYINKINMAEERRKAREAAAANEAEASCVPTERLSLTEEFAKIADRNSV